MRREERRRARDQPSILRSVAFENGAEGWRGLWHFRAHRKSRHFFYPDVCERDTQCISGEENSKA